MSTDYHYYIAEKQLKHLLRESPRTWDMAYLAATTLASHAQVVCRTARKPVYKLSTSFSVW